MKKFSLMSFRGTCILVFLLISGCSSSSNTMTVPLITQASQNLTQTNKNLTLQVAEFENSQLIDANDQSRSFNFQGITAWLRNRLQTINNLDCTLTEKTSVNITVKKLYTTVDSDNLVGALVLHARITIPRGKTSIKNYRGDCEMSFFALDEQQGLRHCFNKSLDLIIPALKHDICQVQTTVNG